MWNWIHNFELFLFDFDGLLVNTEELQHLAYVTLCKKHGYDLKWDFEHYCSIAHSDTASLREEIYKEFPELQKISWDLLYAEKKQAYLEILEEGRVQFMPGAEELLKALEHSNIRRCVVTNSTKSEINKIKEKLPYLNSIPYWVTRESYTKPKPDPEPYLTAISLYGKPEDRIIGFEDTLKGYKALSGVKCTPILISSVGQFKSLNSIRIP